MNPLNGIINIDKPSGMSSFDVIRTLKKKFGFKDKTGFLGTLDPMATGVLPLFFGKATKIIPFVNNEPKIYRINILFGMASDSYDATGQIKERLNPDEVSIEKKRFEEVLLEFTGEIKQKPPIVSAVKINGKRAYKYFREGKDIEIPERTKKIFDIELIKFYNDREYPEAEIMVCCESGTYMRSLAVDIGKALGFPALISKLCRLSSGDFHISDSISIKNILLGKLENFIIPVDKFLNYKEIFISEDSESYHRLINGNEMNNIWQVDSGLYKIKNRNNRLLAIYRAIGNKLKVEKMLL